MCADENKIETIFRDKNIVDLAIQASTVTGNIPTFNPNESVEAFRARMIAVIKSNSDRKRLNAQGIQASAMKQMRADAEDTFRIIVAASLVEYNSSDLLLREGESEKDRNDRIRPIINSHPNAVKLGVQV